MTRNDAREFRSLWTRYFERLYRLFPHEASELGRHEFDAELGDNDERTHREHVSLIRETLEAVENLPASSFTADDWLDRRGFLAYLRTGLLFCGTLERWRTNPQQHCDAAIQSVFGLVIRNAQDLRKVLRPVERRLRKLPAFLSAGAECVRRPVPLWVELAEKACEGSIAFLREIEPEFVRLSRRPSPTRQLFENARCAFRDYAAAISRKTPGPANGFSIGREHFEMMIRERLGLPYSLPEAEAIGYRLTEQMGEALRREAAQFGRRPAREIIEEAAADWQPEEKTLLSEYRRVTRLTRERFEKAGLLSFPPRESLKVLPVPEFLRHQFPTAAYVNPGPFERRQTGIFWVNDLSLGQTDPKRRQREIAQHFGLELTCAHEAYPGHHVQFVIQNRHRSRLRRHFAHAIFYEGWTLWCEKMCVDQGIYRSPHARLMQLNDALWRAWRIVIDCGLHSGKLSYRAACRQLCDGAGFTAGRARGDVNWYTSSPTIPMSYLLGRLELEKLHAHLVGERGWELRRFNDWMLSFGALPWSWIWQASLNGTPLAS